MHIWFALVKNDNRRGILMQEWGHKKQNGETCFFDGNFVF
jgi:hypothetical protein